MIRDSSNEDCKDCVSHGNNRWEKRNYRYSDLVDAKVTNVLKHVIICHILEKKIEAYESEMHINKDIIPCGDVLLT